MYGTAICTKEVPIEVSKEISREVSKEVLREVPKEVSREAPREVLREVSREVPREVPREVSREVEYYNSLLHALSQAAAFLLGSDFGTFDDALNQSVRLIAEAVSISRLVIWENCSIYGRLHCNRLYGFSRTTDMLRDNVVPYNISYNENIPGWEESLSQGGCVNNLVRNMTPEERMLLSARGSKSISAQPVFVKDKFWGFIVFDDCNGERIFTQDELSFMRSASHALVNAILKQKGFQSVRDDYETLELSLRHITAESKAKSDFLSYMSHEMRTPMNAIIGMTSIAINTDDVEQKNSSLQKIKDASSHLLGVVNNILDMTKIEANMLELAQAEYCFDNMLKNVITVINYRIEEKKQRFSVNIDENIPCFVIGDDKRLAQVITNLLANAVKFTPEGGNIHLEVSLINVDDGLCKILIEVSDSGIGISSENQAKLFHAFTQGDRGTSREYGGTGLGLAISKRVVELMGGKIWVESKSGSGAHFSFSTTVKSSPKNPRSLLDANVNWMNIRILVVDETAAALTKFKNLFDRLEMKCDVAADNFEACQLIEKNGGYDIYFVDFRMSAINGIDLARQIKSGRNCRQCVILMTTASDWNLYRDEALEAGVDSFLVKPLFPSMIIESLNACVNAANKEGDSLECKENEFLGMRMLLAEDIEINRTIIMSLLEKTGLIIECAENGQKAYDMFVDEPDKYDIMFMDVQMPYMDGLEATRHIRAIPSLRAACIPIIALTANVFKEDIVACISAGMDDHIGKPLDIDIVLSKLRKYLSLA